MKVSNAIKKLSKYGELKSISSSTNTYYSLTQGEVVLTFIEAKNNIIAIRVKHINDNQEDYLDGTTCKSISEAIRLARFVEVLPKSKSSIVMKKYPKVKSLKTLSVSAKDFIGIPKGVEVK